MSLSTNSIRFIMAPVALNYSSMIGLMVEDLDSKLC